MENLKNYVRKFTDEEYLTKNEIKNIMGNDIEVLWEGIVTYRDNYSVATDLLNMKNIPFTICLTPAILSYTMESERTLYGYKAKFDKYELIDNLSTASSTFIDFKNKQIAKDLYEVSKINNVNIAVSDIYSMINNEMSIDETINKLNKVFKDSIDVKIKENLVKNFINVIGGVLENNSFNPYRRTIIDAKPNMDNISDCMAYLNKFIENEDPAISPFIKAALMMAYFMYVEPFEKYSNLVGYIASSKVLENYGFGKACYYTSLYSYITNNINQLKEALNNSIASSDFTYFMISYLQIFIECMDSVNQDIEVEIEKNAKLIGHGVVEKIVEVIKEVPVEVIKEVEVEKIVEKEVVKEVETKVGVSSSKFDMDKVFDMAPLVKPYIDEPIEDLAQHLLTINPELKNHHAYFYAYNHEVGRYYTIGQFKEYAGCAYETARTSMDYLVALNLYKKEQLKNKYVYTPIDLSKI